MAEENTELNVDETEDVETTDTPAAEESAVDNDQTPGDVPEQGGLDDVPENDSVNDASEQEETSDVPEPANEPVIGDEIPIVEPTRVSTSDGGEITAPITDISMLLDIPVTLSMEIGQTKISINELLKLGKDSVIELQRMAHEPLDVLVNGTLVARGEAVVVGDRFGIRLTDVISPQERLRKFG